MKVWSLASRLARMARWLLVAKGVSLVKQCDCGTSERVNRRGRSPGISGVPKASRSVQMGCTLASGSWDGTVRLWDVKTGEQKQVFTRHEGLIFSVAFSPDGRTLAIGDVSVIRLRDAMTGGQKRVFTGHEGLIFSVAFSPDGRTLASGSSDNTVRLWDVKTSEPKRTLTGHTHYVSSVAFSPDGVTVASGSYDSTVRLWDAVTGEQKQAFVGHIKLGDRCRVQSGWGDRC